jgi:hypothetical protein
VVCSGTFFAPFLKMPCNAGKIDRSGEAASMNIQTTALSQEWTILQNNFEAYEISSLLIKLISIVLFTAGLAAALNLGVMCAVVLMLWVQEGIFRTYQSRLGARLLCVESLLRPGDAMSGAAFQLHTQWHLTRPGVAGLLMEYAASICRPTVAFPYSLLVLACAVAVVRG